MFSVKTNSRNGGKMGQTTKIQNGGFWGHVLGILSLNDGQIRRKFRIIEKSFITGN